MAKNRNKVAVSIIIPTYNRVELLDRAVQSVLRQSFSDWELIIINDASTDTTYSYLEKLQKADERIYAIHNQTNNYPDISKTLNKGLEIAQGKYIARLDDDDYWCDDEKLEKQNNFLDSHPEYVVVGGGTIVIDQTDKEQFRYMKLENDSDIRAKALFANPFTHSTVMFRRDVALLAGGYGDFKNAEDWALWLAMGEKGKFYNFQEYFVRYLMTENNKTFLFKRSQSKEILRLIRMYKNSYPHFLSAFTLNLGQYSYSLLPLGMQKSLHNTLSRTKRSLFSS